MIYGKAAKSQLRKKTKSQQFNRKHSKCNTFDFNDEKKKLKKILIKAALL